MKVRLPTARDALVLCGFLFVTFTGASISAFVTVEAIPAWYRNLAKPAFNPPDGIFGPVWSLLYFLMSVAVWLVWRSPPSPNRTRAIMAFWVQLCLNFLWSLIFFGQKQIGLALAEVIALWIAILVAGVLFFSQSRPAGWMMVPYLAWVTFATLLNFEIWRMN